MGFANSFGMVSPRFHRGFAMVSLFGALDGFAMVSLGCPKPCHFMAPLTVQTRSLLQAM
jgi:hypothetical protein